MCVKIRFTVYKGSSCHREKSPISVISVRYLENRKNINSSFKPDICEKHTFQKCHPCFFSLTASVNFSVIFKKKKQNNRHSHSSNMTVIWFEKWPNEISASTLHKHRQSKLLQGIKKKAWPRWKRMIYEQKIKHLFQNWEGSLMNKFFFFTYDVSYVFLPNFH